jgi:hypothetical protein
MTPEEALHVKAAKLCGWKDVRVRIGPISGYPNERVVMGIAPENAGKRSNQGYRDEVPDYLNDYNATHEMEQILVRKSLVVRYKAELEQIINDRYGGWLTATAAQRAEAFVLTMEPEEDK